MKKWQKNKFITDVGGGEGIMCDKINLSKLRKSLKMTNRVLTDSASSVEIRNNGALLACSLHVWLWRSLRTVPGDHFQHVGGKMM